MTNQPSTEKRECGYEFCENTFEPVVYFQKFCSDACRINNFHLQRAKKLIADGKAAEKKGG